VGVLLLVVGVLEELGRHALGVDALRHEVVALVTEHADDLRCKRLVQQPQHHPAVGVVPGSHRALRDVLPGPLAQGLDVGEERSGHWLVLLRLFGSRRGGAAGGRALLVVLGVRRLLRGTLGAVALDLRLLDARVLGFAFLVVALLSRDVVGGFGLGFAHVLLRLRLVLVVLGVELGLGDLLLAVGLERVALLLVGLGLRLDALVLGFLDLVLVDLLRLRGRRERERHGQRDAGDDGFHRSPWWWVTATAFSTGPPRARPGKEPRTLRTGSWRSRPRRQRCR